MPAFEVMARDESTLWVWSETEQWLRDSLKGAYNLGMQDVDDVALGLTPSDYAFIMPKDVQALHDRLRELAGHPRLNQMVRGSDYIHCVHGRVTFIASHPHDGAFLICQQVDVDDDCECPYFGCEADALCFLPPEENQKP